MIQAYLTDNSFNNITPLKHGLQIQRLRNHWSTL